IDAPIHKIGLFIIKAGVDMPTRIPRIIGRGKAHRKGSHAPAWQPASLPGELVKGRTKCRRIGCSDNRLLVVHTQTYYRICPRIRIVRHATVSTQVFPEDGPRLVREFARERMFDFHEAIADELLHLCFSQYLCQLGIFGLSGSSHGVNRVSLAMVTSWDNIRTLILI